MVFFHAKTVVFFFVSKRVKTKKCRNEIYQPQSYQFLVVFAKDMLTIFIFWFCQEKIDISCFLKVVILQFSEFFFMANFLVKICRKRNKLHRC